MLTSPTRSCSASRARCAPAGLAVTHDRATSFLEAAAMVGRRRPARDLPGRAGDAVRGSGRPGPLRPRLRGLVRRRASSCRAPSPRDRPREISPPLPVGEPGEHGGEVSPDVIHAAASDVEVLRHRDVAALKPDEKALLDAMIAALAAPAAPASRAASYAVAPRGDRHAPHPAYDAAPDGRAGPGRAPATRDDRRAGWCCSWTCRRRCGRTPTRSCGWHTSSRRPGRANGPGTVEVFTLGTRLTRITLPLRTSRPRASAGACGGAGARTGRAAPAWARR